MSDLTSLRAIIKLRAKLNSSYIDACIADALRHVRNEQLHFNTGSFTFATTNGTAEYPLPNDFLSILGEVYYTPDEASESGRYKLQPVGLDELEEYRYRQDWGADEISGESRRVAIDLSGRKILFAPTPDTDGDKVFFRYLKDLGTPVYTASTTASAPPSLSPTITLLGPDGQTLNSDYTTPWFTHAFELVANRAVHILWSKYHGGTPEAAQKAQEAQVAYLEELSRLRGETSMKTNHLRIRPYI